MKPRGIIVLEGGDCSGKSTLADHFVEKYGAKKLHGRIFPDMWKYHTAMLRLALKWADTELVVIDRLHLSELIYGQVYRGGPAYDVAARCIDRVLQRAGAITVLCVPTDQEKQLSIHATRAAEGGEAFFNIREVVALFADLRHGNLARPGDGYLHHLIRFGDFAHRADVLVYDFDAHGKVLKRFASEVIDHLGTYRRSQYTPALHSGFYNVAGHALTATHLFVGEGDSPRRSAARWPFYWSEDMSAATYLNQALHAIAFDETRAMWTNAATDDHQLEQLLKLNKKTIAFGSVAFNRVRELSGRSVPTVKHPQWQRRFAFHELPEYATSIKRALSQ